MLKKVLEILREKKYISLRELQISLDMELSAIEDIITILIEKGKIKEIESHCISGCGFKNMCKTCQQMQDKRYTRVFMLNE